jgi:DNA-3-methyladenine glycosylase
MITEVEAYDGFSDEASHASRGKTARNAPMFGEAGRWYIYFTYGMHWMLNIVTGKKDYPAAVLIRALGNPVTKLNGPAKLTKYLKIDKRFNDKIASHKTGLWIEYRGIKIKKSQIMRAPRIGVDYAGKWAKKPYRFYVEKIPGQ